jgi:hypothetical protein
VVGYSDADWGANPNDRKSITSYAFLLGSAPISWASQKQKSMVLSSMEAEYMAAASATSQALWCQMLLKKLGFEQSGSIHLKMDNQSALAFAHNTGAQGCTKHIDIRYHFLHDKIELQEIVVSHYLDEDNLANIFTKALAQFKFNKFHKMLGMSVSKRSVDA